MSWIGGLFERESLPVLEASMAMAAQRQVRIANNIANADTPHYRRQELPENAFQRSLVRAIDDRERFHWNDFRPQNGIGITWRENHAQADMTDGREFGPRRHDENAVNLEKEMGDMAKNTLYMSALQRLFKNQTQQMMAALRDRIA